MAPASDKVVAIDDDQLFALMKVNLLVFLLSIKRILYIGIVLFTSVYTCMQRNSFILLIVDSSE